ncbi:MAG: hypothetical protein IPI38_04310 [Gemmatimonadetes bacterium]|nr:hypothetical protein [Gemmatimonadota bacterium]MBP6668926.1 hypothetical protein [Gemmatimonadales bacterium]MBK6778623.1 hypothetical protein [Gemmatimonadota bacterium]MBK7349068.1 hypothetical protein [Gemmatimonadota bacterium]MBK7714631.1 hypothetical protein [Gemmatimonadota bacterium]
MKIRATVRFAALLLTPAVPPAPAAAQSPDEGTLVIHAGDREVGGESFRVTVTEGTVRVASKSVFTGTRPATEFTVNSERTATGALAFQLAYRGVAGAGEVYAVQQRSRLTMRRVEKGAERASEVPGGPSILLLADSTFSPILQAISLAAETPRAVTAFIPRSGRKLALTIRRVPAAAGGSDQVQITGDLEASIDLGPGGEVVRILYPSLGMEAVRKRD